MEKKAFGSNIDWLILLLYIILCIIGLVSIYSTEVTPESELSFDLSKRYIKQLSWFLICLIIIAFILVSDLKHFWKFSGILYIIGVLLLISLFLFGKKINGSVSWFDFGVFNVQPTELAKIATALAISMFLANREKEKSIKKFLFAFVIILIPMILIAFQPDPGSALVFCAFVIPFYREGLNSWFILLCFICMGLFLLVVAFGAWIIITICLSLILLFIVFIPSQRKFWKIYLFLVVIITSVSLGTQYGFYNVLAKRHQDRFNVLVSKVPDSKEFRRGIGYNLDQSLTAIGSGGFKGKGFLNGTLTNGNFVPEQATDYIFCSIGEQFGFLGSSFVVLLYSILIARILFKAEKNINQFARIYGYCVAAIFLLHIIINIGMTIGLMPTIGIPLPLISYGGSSLLGFTLLLFLFIKLDLNRSKPMLGHSIQ